MINFTIDTYEIKRKIIKFSNKLTCHVGKVQTKFVQDMIYGLAKSKSVLLSNISDALMKPIKKINVIERLSNNLVNELNSSIKTHYNYEVNKVIGKSPNLLRYEIQEKVKSKLQLLLKVNKKNAILVSLMFRLQQLNF